MKAILIDSKNREVKEIEIGNGIDEMYKFLECQYFTIASHLTDNDAIFVDDEGLMNGTNVFFTYDGAHQPFAGNGLIMGCNDEGNSVDCKINITEVKNKVEFYNKNELMMAIAFGKVLI